MSQSRALGLSWPVAQGWNFLKCWQIVTFDLDAHQKGIRASLGTVCVDQMINKVYEYLTFQTNFC